MDLVMSPWPVQCTVCCYVFVYHALSSHLIASSQSQSLKAAKQVPIRLGTLTRSCETYLLLNSKQTDRCSCNKYPIANRVFDFYPVAVRCVLKCGSLVFQQILNSYQALQSVQGGVRESRLECCLFYCRTTKSYSLGHVELKTLSDIHAFCYFPVLH